MRRISNPVIRTVRLVGPGLVTGASDDDPSGVGTYAVAGAGLGFATLWTTLVSLPMMVATQFIAAKIGLVTGRGLAGVLRKHYPGAVMYPVVLALALTNAINAGVDIGAIAASFNLLIPVPIIAMIVPIGLAILALQVWASYRLIANIFKLLTLAFFAYIGAAVLAKPSLGEVLRGTFVPTLKLNGAYLATLVALFGTTISPYMWFWQADQEVEERIALGQKRLWQRQGTSDTELRYMAWDVNVGMIFSNVIAYFIILATAATLFKTGKTDIQSAAAAADALRPLAGNAARILFAVGLLASGLLAVPILTASGAYAIAEAFGWKHGLDQKLHRAPEFYGVLSVSMGIGMLMNFMGVNPIRALFLTAVLNGFLTPPLLAILMLISNDRVIMGHRVNGLGLNVVGWTTTALMTGAVVALVLTWGKG